MAKRKNDQPVKKNNPPKEFGLQELKSGEHRQKGLEKIGVHFREQAKQLENHIEKMKELLFAINRS